MLAFERTFLIDIPASLQVTESRGDDCMDASGAQRQRTDYDFISDQ